MLRGDTAADDTRETLLLLPGMMCDERLFTPQIEEFGSAYQLVIGNLWGSDTLDGLAETILQSVPEREFSILGLSMGGIVAMAMAALAPERVKRLALLDTNHLADPPERRDMRERQIAKVREGHLKEIIVDELKPHYVAARNRDNKELLDLLVDMAMELGARRFIQQSEILLSRGNQAKRLQRFNGPALVMCGEEDQLCPPSRHQEISKLLVDAEFVLVPGAGHITTLENSEFVNREIRRWMCRDADTIWENQNNEPN